jgi:hypothetical protein
MRIFAVSLLIVLMGTGCTEKPSIADHLIDAESWRLTGHCDEFGFVTFRPDGSGVLIVDDECVVGFPCINSLPFNWTVDEDSGLLTVIYNNQSSAQLICSEGISSNSGIYPATETTIVGTETVLISLQGYLFEN